MGIATLAFLLIFTLAELATEKVRDKPTEKWDFPLLGRAGHGQSALHLAAWLGNAKQCRFLLKNGAKVDEIDNFSKTPLMVASAYGHVEAVQAILEFNPDTEIKDRSENTVLNVATPECARFIRKHQIAKRNLETISKK